MWYNEFGSVFFITIATLSFGSIAMCLKYCLKSKCTVVGCKCWGCDFNIMRDVAIEEEIELALGNEEKV